MTAFTTLAVLATMMIGIAEGNPFPIAQCESQCTIGP
jgi:hypothetical protein